MTFHSFPFHLINSYASLMTKLRCHLLGKASLMTVGRALLTAYIERASNKHGAHRSQIKAFPLPSNKSLLPHNTSLEYIIGRSIYLRSTELLLCAKHCTRSSAEIDQYSQQVCNKKQRHGGIIGLTQTRLLILSPRGQGFQRK